jgi:hypothetical protein
MKQAIKLTLLGLILFGCNSPDNESRLFFNYDEIDYYFNNYDEEGLTELFDNRSRSELDSFRLGIILDDIPESIKDSTFIAKLQAIGYKKGLVNKSRFNEIDDLFSEKRVKKNISTKCIDIYRDILIFKKHNRLVGTVKVCFECMAHQITGSKYNTENFGEGGDYHRLETLLKN